MGGLGQVSLLSGLCLSACVTAAPIVEPGAAFADLPVTVDTRAFVATFVPGTVGTTLTAAGAVPVQGTGVRISGEGLGRDEGIIAKEAARIACIETGGVFQPQAIGRYAEQGAWAFDGACV